MNERQAAQMRLLMRLTKETLARKVYLHPRHVHPEYLGLCRWTKEELARTYVELTGGDTTNAPVPRH